MLIVQYRKQFKKDYQKLKRRGKDIKKLEAIINLLIQGKSLSPKNRNHKLHGQYNDCWECHTEPDWLLIYLKNDTELILIATGSHSDLF